MTVKNLMTHPAANPNKLLQRMMLRLLMAVAVLGVLLFIPAGTFDYWEAWVYMIILIVPATLTMLYFLKKDPELLERRMRMKEKESEQKLIVIFSYLAFFIAFVIPGLDRRYGWSALGPGVVISADIVILSGYALFIRVIVENRYASRVIEVAEKQRVISTGPYAIVRHPMYVAALLIYICTPLALGTLWALLPMLFLVFLIIARILNEEKVLIQELEGYREYISKTRYRLLPGIW